MLNKEEDALFSFEPVETWIKEIKIGNNSFLFDGFRCYFMGELVLTPTEPGHPLYVKDEAQAVHVTEDLLAHGARLLEVTTSLQSSSQANEIILSTLKTLKDTFFGVSLAIRTNDENLVKQALKADLIDFVTLNEWTTQETLISILNEHDDVAVALMNDLLFHSDSETDFVEATFEFYSSNIKKLGLEEREKLLIDLGIGMGYDKRKEFELLGSLAEFRNELEKPVVLTVRWNAYFEDMTQLSIMDRFSPLIAFSTMGLLQGADVIRTRDVAPLSEMVHVIENFKMEFGD